jgi:non-ribosomal peptide synthetase component F
MRRSFPSPKVRFCADESVCRRSHLRKTLSGDPFPKNFKAILKQIYKRLWRVYAHLYYSHAQEIVNLGIEPHVNTAFKHFYLFIVEFNLVEQKELEPRRFFCFVLMPPTTRFASPSLTFSRVPWPV